VDHSLSCLWRILNSYHKPAAGGRYVNYITSNNCLDSNDGDSTKQIYKLRFTKINLYFLPPVDLCSFANKIWQPHNESTYLNQIKTTPDLPGVLTNWENWALARQPAYVPPLNKFSLLPTKKPTPKIFEKPAHTLIIGSRRDVSNSLLQGQVFNK